MPPPSAPDFFQLQSVALEFHVTGSLDGSTVPDPFPVPPDPAARGLTDPRTGAVVIEVENLGLIDLAGGRTGVSGDRIIRSLLIAGPNAVGVGVEATIGLAFDGISSPSGGLVIPPGANGIVSENCIFVPQTAMVQLVGLDASPGEPILVRLCLWLPRTVEEYGEMGNLCCCRANTIDEEGEPFYTTALYVGAACSRTVTGAAPPSAARGAGFTVVTLTGTNFTDGDIVVFIHEDGLGVLPIDQINVVNPTTILVRVDVNGAVPLGDYNIIVAPPLAPPRCQGIGEGLFTVT